MQRESHPVMSLAKTYVQGKSINELLIWKEEFVKGVFGEDETSFVLLLTISSILSGLRVSDLEMLALAYIMQTGEM